MTQTRPKSPILIEKQQLAPDHIQLNYQVPADMHYFEGHFTNAPVVAGVVQLQWVAEAITEHFGHQLLTGGMEAVKFHQLLFPEQHFLLDLRRKADKGKWLYKITSGEALIASGRYLDMEVTHAN